MYLHNLKTSDDFVDMMEYMDNIFQRSGTKLNTKDPTYTGLSLFGTGDAFTFFEQYAILSSYAAQILLSALLGVTFVCTVLSGPIPALCTGLIVTTMIFELYGLLGLCGVKMSALPMVTILR